MKRCQTVIGVCEDGDAPPSWINCDESDSFARLRTPDAFTSIGCYTLIYRHIEGDERRGETYADLCAKCAGEVRDRSMVDGPRVEIEPAPHHSNLKTNTIYVETYDEGEPLFCQECGAEIVSSYGDPEEHEFEPDRE